jgi:alpha-beta hydrolase superfamily lysophospholipase
MKNGLDPNDLARDAKVGAAYTADPLVHAYTTARLGLDLLNSGNYIIEHADNIQIPILLMQGTSDKLVNPKLTKEFADHAPAKFVTYKEWQGYYHELHNEPEKADVLKTMVDWLNSHI